jgi:hypothetical protein
MKETRAGDSDNMEDKLKRLKLELSKYEIKLADKKKYYRGVIHENSLSELRYTEYMVYRDMVDGLKKEIRDLEQKLKVK